MILFSAFNLTARGRELRPACCLWVPCRQAQGWARGWSSLGQSVGGHKYGQAWTADRPVLNPCLRPPSWEPGGLLELQFLFCNAGMITRSF